jgi:pyruvate-formate lyase
MNRKKRLKKRIESLKEQIEIHEKKREQAEKQDMQELAEYYGREIKAKKRTLDESQKMFDKQ